MKLFSAAQIRDWDQYTILHEPVRSIDLMERAAEACFRWLKTHRDTHLNFAVFCGRGNNGGDGLALARLLAQTNATVTVYIPSTDTHTGSKDFHENLMRLQQEQVAVHFIRQVDALPSLQQQDIIIECLFGTGLNRPLDGLSAQIVTWLNNSSNEIISVDLPAGLFADQSSVGNVVVRAAHTLTFQAFKLALLLPENAPFAGDVHVLDIGLDAGYASVTPTAFFVSDEPMMQALYRPRKRFAHKGTYGHALLVAGSYGKMGAAVMAANACLRTGAGLLTVCAPACGMEVLQSSAPEAMFTAGGPETTLNALPDELDKYSVIGIGPGIGTSQETAALLQSLGAYNRPVVVDADALNILATHPRLLEQLPQGSVLTPHPKEFERLFGKAANDFERLHMALKQARQLLCIVVLKGHHTFIALPDGRGYFNNTGNAGMAKGGSGDVLTGMITGLLSQGYAPAEAAILGVYLHGLAGDITAEAHGMESMLPTDLIQNIGRAWMQLSQQL